jgi:2-haloacid dehalogenase
MERLYVFDAYGTLFDVHSAVARHCEAIGPQAQRLSELWRSKQLEYTWTLTLMGRYRDFWQLTCDALDHAIAATGPLDAAMRDELLGAYRRLDAYGEVGNVLSALRRRGGRTAILSNGTAAMLGDAIQSAGLSGLFDTVFSLDPLQRYKTHSSCYALVCDQFGVAPQAVSFQSSNRWDIAGAAAFGMKTVWINRHGQPDEYADLPPDRVLDSLSGLLLD